MKNIGMVVIGAFAVITCATNTLYAQNSDRLYRQNDTSVWQNLPGNINQSSGTRTPLFNPDTGVPDDADARTNAPETSAGIPSMGTAPAQTPPPGLNPTQTTQQSAQSPRRRSMLKGQREIRSAALSTRNAEANLQAYFDQDPEALIQCDGYLVRLSNVRVSGVHAHEPVYPPEQTDEVSYLRATIYFRGIVPASEPYCPEETIKADVEAVRLLSDAEGSNRLGVWYVPTWDRSLSERR